MKQYVEMPEGTQLTLEWWRNEFDRLFELAPDFQRKSLIIYDSHFITAIGKDDIRNVKAKKASYEKTRRVVLALEKLVKDTDKHKKTIERIMKRQNLVA